MATSYTPLLGLALPVTGELAGTWGDVVSDQITSLLDSAVAGTTTLSSDADVTLTDTDGAANQSRQAILLWTANGTVTRTITAPARTKTYVVINATAGSQSIKLVGAGPTTGITLVAGEKCVASWNGSDFVKVASSVADGVTSVAMTVPTGLSISGSPITSAGTLALTLTAGYSIPTTASQTNWDSAYTQRLQWDGGSTNLVAATGRTSLGGTTAGQSFFTLTNPSAITFPRINADNSVSALDAATFRTAIGAGTSSTTGTVTSVGMTVPAFLSVSGSPITSSGTLAVSYSGTALPVANGGTGQTTKTEAFDALAPTTTKGDLIAHNGTDNVRVALGTDGYLLTADSTQASGVKWAAAPASGVSAGKAVALAMIFGF